MPRPTPAFFTLHPVKTKVFYANPTGETGHGFFVGASDCQDYRQGWLRRLDPWQPCGAPAVVVWNVLSDFRIARDCILAAHQSVDVGFQRCSNWILRVIASAIALASGRLIVKTGARAMEP